MLKDVIVDEASLEKVADAEDDRVKIFCMQNLLTWHALCEHSHIVEVPGAQYSIQSLIKSV